MTYLECRCAKVSRSISKTPAFECCKFGFLRFVQTLLKQRHGFFPKVLAGSAMLISLVLLFQVLSSYASSCLPDAIPLSQRRELQTESDSFPLGFVRLGENYEWQPLVLSILVEEVLGVQTVFDSRTTPWSTGVFVTAGCEENGTEWQCTEQLPSRTHVFWAATLSSLGREALDKVQRTRVGGILDDLGSVGYSISEYYVVAGTVIQKAFEEDGLALDYFRSYHERNKEVLLRHFSKISEVNTSDLVPCSEWLIWDQANMQAYEAVTGDTAGVRENAGSVLPRCEESGVWWLAPTCRGNASGCIPAITCETWGFAWYVEELMQKATIWKMPLAIGSARGCVTHPGSHLERLFNQSKLIFLSGSGIEAQYPSLNPVPIVFPEHNPREWKQNRLISQKLGWELWKIVHQDLAKWAPQLLEFFRRAEFQREDDLEISQQLGFHGFAGHETLRAAACTWVQNHRDLWTPWIPKATSCFPGQGLFFTSATDTQVPTLGQDAAIDRNAGGFFVSQRDKANTCRACPPGRYSALISDDISDTAECRPCEPGFKQSSSGQVACDPCLHGTFTAEAGVSICEKCPQGQYQHLTASTQCESCAEQQTTDILGAVSGSDCKCEPASFWRNGRCQPCPLGLSCAGGNFPPQQQAGFWAESMSNDSEISVYRCQYESHCPSGVPGSCAFARVGRACAVCLEGFWAALDGGCRSCAEFLWWPWAALVIGILLVSLAFVLPSDCFVSGKKLSSLMMVSIMAGQTIVALQVRHCFWRLS